jgi:predicted PurR-regulated permease PerM
VREEKQSIGDARFVNRAVEAALRIGVLVVLVAWCFDIIRPFVTAVAWAAIIATAVFPLYQRLELGLGRRRGPAAVLFTLLMLVVFIVPILLLSGTMVETAHQLSADLSDGALSIPPPPEKVATWRFIGEPLYEFWSLASENLAEALEKVSPQLKALGSWSLSLVASAGFGILQFLLAILIAGALLAHAERGSRMTHAIAARLVGRRGPEFADLAQDTVRSVARGILGVALIQALVAGLGFLLFGLPAPGLLSLICLLLAVVQIGILPVLLPAVIYMFSVSDPVTAGLFLAWCLFAGVIDNILKPLLLGRGVRVPMLVIFVGAIGGLIASGIIGLFVGAVVLALSYTLFQAWLSEAPDGAAAAVPPATAVSPPAAVAPPPGQA